LIRFRRGAAGMFGPVEGRIPALPDGPFAAPRRHQRRGSLPMFRLRENPATPIVVVAFTSGRIGITARSRRTPPSSHHFIGSERRCHLQRIDFAHRRLSNSQTHQR
jgi:hypothetical protein